MYNLCGKSDDDGLFLKVEEEVGKEAWETLVSSFSRVDWGAGATWTGGYKRGRDLNVNDVFLEGGHAPRTKKNRP